MSRGSWRWVVASAGCGWIGGFTQVVAQDTAVETAPPPQVLAEAPAEVLFPLAVGTSWTYAPLGGGPATVERLVEMQSFDGQTWYRLRGGEPAAKAEGQGQGLANEQPLADPPADPAAASANTSAPIRPADEASPPEGAAAEGQPDAAPNDLWELWLANLPGGQADAELVRDDPASPAMLVQQRLYYRYPVEVGQIYQIDPNQPPRMIVMAVDQPVQVPAGKFTCIVYKEIDPQQPGYIFTTFVAPGVGTVMTQTLEDGELSTDVLIAFERPELGPKPSPQSMQDLVEWPAVEAEAGADLTEK